MTDIKKTAMQLLAPEVVRRGRGRPRSEALHPAVQQAMDYQAARAEERRQRLRKEAQERGESRAPGQKSELWERLRAARHYAQRTQREVALALGVTRGAVALWESEDPGNRTTPRADQLQIIANMLNVPVEFFLDDSFAPTEIWKASDIRRGEKEARAVTAEDIDVIMQRLERVQQEVAQISTTGHKADTIEDEGMQAMLAALLSLDEDRRRALVAKFNTVLEMESILPKN